MQQHSIAAASLIDEGEPMQTQAAEEAADESAAAASSELRSQHSMIMQMQFEERKGEGTASSVQINTESIVTTELPTLQRRRSKRAAAALIDGAAAAAAASSIDRAQSMPVTTISAPPPPPKRRRNKKAELAATTAAASSAAAAAAASDLATDTQEMPLFTSLDESMSFSSAEEIAIRTGEVVSRSLSAVVASSVSSQKIVVRRKKKKAAPVYDAGDYAPQALVSRKWVGAHVSAAGGPVNAIYNASAIGARAFAMDTRSKRKWTSPPLDPEDATAFREALVAFKYTPAQVLPHGSYLMNLGSPRSEVFRKSQDCLLAELERCGALGLHLYNFHPGSTCGEISKEDCMLKIAASLNAAHKATASLNGGKGVVTVLENMAGQGGVIGSDFRDLRFIIDRIEDKTRVGVCIDTCHAFAAGIDVRTAEAVDAMLRSFDEIVGLQYLRGLHLNDSKSSLGCRKDRHESIGAGCIGAAGFQALMRRPELDQLPLILETPCPDMDQAHAKYSNEIAALYAMESDALPETRAGFPLPYNYTPPTAEELEAIKQERAAKAAKKRAAKNQAAAAAKEEEEEDEEEGEGAAPDEDEEADDEQPKPKSKSVKSKGRSASAASASAAAAASKPTAKPSKLKKTNSNATAAAPSRSESKPAKLKRNQSDSNAKENH